MQIREFAPPASCSSAEVGADTRRIGRRKQPGPSRSVESSACAAKWSYDVDFVRIEFMPESINNIISSTP
jgi:hypothetical protein